MRKLVLLSFVLATLLSGRSFAQSGSYYSNVASIAGAGNIQHVIPNAPVVVCNYPATGGVPCTNLGTTYTNLALGTACPSNKPVVAPGTNTCIAGADSAGNFAFYGRVGSYAYYFQSSPGTWQGPYTAILTTTGFQLQINGVNASTSAGAISLNQNGLINLVDQGNGQILVGTGALTAQNLVLFPPMFSSATSLRNKTLLIMVPAGTNLGFASTNPTGGEFQAIVRTGTLTIGHAYYFTTNPLDMHVNGKAGPISFSGNTSNITLTASTNPSLFQGDTFLFGAAGPPTNGQDSYLAIYFADVAGNDTVTVAQATTGVQVPEALVAGDATTVTIGNLLNGGTQVTSYASHTLVGWFEVTQ